MSTGPNDALPSRDESAPLDIESIVDLEALRGWSEHRDPELRAPHRLPALAQLVELGGDDQGRTIYPIHGPDVLVGRSHFRHPPVDLPLQCLRDHQLYRLATPHVRLWIDDGAWCLRVLNPRCETELNGQVLDHGDCHTFLSDGDNLTLGVTRFRFARGEATFAEWRRRKRHVLGELDAPTLLLERFGAPCGPLHPLNRRQPLIVGRTHPGPDAYPDTSHWPEPDDLFWDLSGVFDFERTYVAFRHVAVEWCDEQWTLQPLSPGHQTFLNGSRVSEPEVIRSGDRIGLGSVVLRFYDPGEPDRDPPPSTIPEIVDWSEGRSPIASMSEEEE